MAGRRWAGRMSLRRSTMLSVVALTCAALVVTGVTSALALRSNLLARLDAQLLAAAAVIGQRGQLVAGAGSDWTQVVRSAVAPTEFLVEVRRPDGGLSRFASTTELPPRPLLDRAPVPPGGGRSALTTVTTGAGERYRVVTVEVNGAVALVGLPMRPVEETVLRLVRIEVVVSAVVVLLLAILARWLVASRLRPLDHIERTAAAIAAGDLDRRVPIEDDPDRLRRTEVGRLTLAVNGMLARIHVAMAARARSEERMRAFVADASHELRTPLTSIRGYAHLLRTGVVDPAGRPDVLNRVDDEAIRMSRIVNDLLFLAQLDAEPALRREPVDLAVIARDAVADALAVEPDRQLALDAPAHLDVLGDGDALRQVMANLLGNVRAHTPADSSATVSVRRSAGVVRVAVADTGPGMSPEAAGRAFDRFFRADTGRSRTDGSGLGLAIVAEAIRAMGGKVGVDSVLGRGTTVWFTIRTPDS
ncbi:HAMP domain-containing sensor histidine kinase [Micromonospora sp. WMMA1363]|uniref:sensor histidine kinase n=1 Tax=Micromonospora sp. WMMA1363 TaxID=3053985 RepID=UPI00259C80A8|nr:HAMP domain-containing sensor histidine kinase [Micromonospora sp. WMMA1363]MDM4722527.1 HAMP domain-containing sensor histidine kinase [Micromonospora sp. WMMA1363]